MFTLNELEWLKEAVFNELLRYEGGGAPRELWRLLDKIELEIYKGNK